MCVYIQNRINVGKVQESRKGALKLRWDLRVEGRQWNKVEILGEKGRQLVKANTEIKGMGESWKPGPLKIN